MNRNVNQYMDDEEEEYHDNSPENSDDSPPSAMFNDSKITSTSSPRKSRRGAQKRVVSVPINDVEKSKLKGEMNTPPSDSWAWRKYGQKPIKGSPYPRGYYRCSSSKGCPARKQVERSKVDPTKLLVTYSCEHSHPWPASRKNRNQNQSNQNVRTTFNDNTSTNVTRSASSEDDQKKSQLFVSDGKFTNFEGSLTWEFGWFTELESSATLLESPLLARDYIADKEMATKGEEDDSFFADLDELPECSSVFRRGVMETQGDSRWCSFTTLL